MYLDRGRVDRIAQGVLTLAFALAFARGTAQAADTLHFAVGPLQPTPGETKKAFDPFFIPGSVYPRLYAYWKSLYLHGLDDALIDDLVGRARELPSEQCLIAIWQLGGALARVPETATAFGRRSAPFLLSYDSCWTDPNQNDDVIAWTREQIAAAEPYSPGGSYLNFPGVGEDNESLVRKAYGSNYERLAQIKRIYDPRNLFRMNQNIVPAAA